MVTMHYEKFPYQRDLFNIPTAEVDGKFKNWEENAKYHVELTVILQIDTTNVSDAEYNVAPNITFLTTNQAIINVFKTYSFTGSFEKFQEWYAKQETSLQYYIDDLISRLNTARNSTGLTGQWYINYGYGNRVIKVSKP